VKRCKGDFADFKQQLFVNAQPDRLMTEIFVPHVEWRPPFRNEQLENPEIL